MATFLYTSSSTSTTADVYGNSNTWESQPVTYTKRTESVLDALAPLPAIQLLVASGLVGAVTNLIVPDKMFEEIAKVIGKINPYSFACTVVNADFEGLFFNSINPERGSIIIYGIFDDDAMPVEIKANFIKKCVSLLLKGGKLVLIADKEHPENLKDLVTFTNVNVSVHDIEVFEERIETRGIYLTKL